MLTRKVGCSNGLGQSHLELINSLNHTRGAPTPSHLPFDKCRSQKLAVDETDAKNSLKSVVPLHVFLPST